MRACAGNECEAPQKSGIVRRLPRPTGNRARLQSLSRGNFSFESELVLRNAYNGVQSKSYYIYSIAPHHLFFWLMLVEL
jgi:hypothetical protein